MNKLQKVFDVEVLDALSSPEHQGAFESIQRLALEKLARRNRRRWFVVMLALLVTSFLAGFGVARWTRHNSPSIDARIVVPQSGASVTREIRVRGTVSGNLRGSQLVLAVEREGLIWPKEAEFRFEGNAWEALVFDHGVEEGRFKLSLWNVSLLGQERIREWLGEARKTNNFNGLQGIQDARWLDAITVQSVR